MTWDPVRYEQFLDHRLRPGIDLMNRIGRFTPSRIVDLGCGTGRLTRLLAGSHPDSEVVGVDSSPEMLEQAQQPPSAIRWVQASVTEWEPDHEYGLIFSNAALHWLDDHPALFARLGSWVPAGGVLAVQMPDNWNQPTHTIPSAMVEGPEFRDVSALLARNRVAPPARYREWLGDGLTVDLWTTTYHQILEGEDPVFDWVSATVLAPVLAALDPSRRDRFAAECVRRYREVYPPEPDGTTILPFRRLFIVARR
ncbi:MAG: methyltransferase domain-containing protein [Acidimicrobiia bacterium]